MKHEFNEKSIADVVEALIGCFLLNCSDDFALHFMNSFLDIKILPESKSIYGFKVPDPCLVPTKRLDALADVEMLTANLSTIESKIKYEFVDLLFLVQALTHASYTRNTLTDNYQRLEFLGDAILDYLITRRLFQLFPDLDPGSITDLRSALVNNVLFASIAVQLGLHKVLKHLSLDLQQEINQFEAFLEVLFIFVSGGL